MGTTRKQAVPLGVPTLVGVVGMTAVALTGGQSWQLVVSAVLAAVLVGVDLTRAARRKP